MSDDRRRILLTGHVEPRLVRALRALVAPRSALVAPLAALAIASCSPSDPQTSSSTHWLECQRDADCSNLALGARCGSDGYCASEDGTRLALTLVFSDEFEGAVLDSGSFGYETGSGIRNAELQAYTDRSENVRVEGGALVLTARAEAFDGADYTSGSVNTAGKHAFAFGRAEVTLRAPIGQGAGAAAWMLPDTPGAPVLACIDPDPCFNSTWPAWGDIIIASLRSETPGNVLHGINYGIWDDAVGGVRHGVVLGPDYTVASPDTEWHVYALDWGPERMDWSVDGTPITSMPLPPTDLYLPEGQDPFHQPFYLQLNLAVGGLNEAPAPEEYPQELRVDSVRVWQWQPEG